MNKRILFIFFLSLVFFLVGCEDQSTTVFTQNNTEVEITVNLYLDETNLNSTHTINAGDELALPMINTDDEHIYVGWSDGSNIYSGFISATEDMDLYLVQESVLDVFDLGDVNPQQTAVSIFGYTGQSKYLKIPEFINGLAVTSIFGEAFKDSDLIEVYIPNNVINVYYFSFEGSTNLKKVEFYGEIHGTKTRIMTQLEFETILNENQEVCTIIDEAIDGTVTYSDTCPIKQSKETYIGLIQGVEYYSYEVEISLQDYPENYYQVINKDAFKDCIALEEFIMPISPNTIFHEAFYNTPKLKELDFGLNEDNYTIVDGIVYSKDMEILIYYPNGLEAEVFTIPDTVDTIRGFAFYNNPYLKKIIIPASVTDIRGFSFYDLDSLEEFEMVSSNEKYFVENGILFNKVNNLDYLLRYPQNKALDTYSLTSNVSYIGEYAFAYNMNLTSIDLGNQVEYIGNAAFYGVEKITQLDIPNTVTTLGAVCIDNSSIDTIIIRRSLVVDGSITSMLSFIIKDRFTVDIYVPDDSLNDYLTDRLWTYYGTNISEISEYIE